MEMNWEEVLGIAELEVTGCEITTQKIYLDCRSKLGEAYCPQCLKKCNFVKDHYIRQVRDSAVCGKELHLRLEVRQFVCSACNRHFNERFSFVNSSSHYTLRYQSRLYDLCKGADFSYVSRQENIHWNVLKQIFETIAQWVLGQRKVWSAVRNLGIDEIALRKGHKNYVAVLVDLDTGIVLDILADRSKAYLKAYFLAKGEAFCAQIESFCSDLWEGYLNCAQEVFPQAVLVADRFHFFAHFQKALDKCRQALREKNKADETLKNLCWVLLKPVESLHIAEKQQLKEVFAQPEYQALKHTWEARNDFRAILETQCTPQEAEVKIEAWQKQYSQQPNPYLNKFMDFYTTWKSYILNYFAKRFTTSLIEGINNKLKLIKRRAYGFLSFESFRLRAMVEFDNS
jgi:transposase